MKKYLQFKSFNPLIILKTCIISPLVRRNFKLGSFKNSNLSPYVNVFTSNSNLVALRCTFSTEVDCLLRCGCQIALPYSKCGLTNALYNLIKPFLVN